MSELVKDLEERVMQLESKIAFQEDTIDQLNDALCDQQKQMQQLNTTIGVLTEKLKELISDKSDQPGHFSADAERPPHY